MSSPVSSWIRCAFAALATSLCASGVAGADPFAFRDTTVQARLDGIKLVDGAWFGVGVAFVDLDGDLWPDLYIGGPRGGHDTLCINLHDGTFSCAEVGPTRTTVSLAIAGGDFDNDGDLDLYVMAGGPGTLLANDGHAHFTDVTQKTHAAGDGNYTPTGTFLDYDGDGRLDLYLGKGDAGFDGAIGPPQLLSQQPDGTFLDIIHGTSLDAMKNTLAILAFDYDADMRQDLLVTGNFDRMSLYHNDGGGRFTDVTLLQPLEVQSALVEGMGIDIADFDGDGDFDLYASNSITNPANAGSAFFLNNGDGTFTSKANEYGVLGAFGWGTSWYDFDDDGWPDVLLAGNDAPHYFLYRNVDGQRFDTQFLPRPPGGATIDCVGAAFADYDRDGRVDFLLARHNGMGLELWHNETPALGHYLSVHLTGAARRDPVGALVEVQAGDRKIPRQVLSQSSKGAQNERALHFGVGAATTVDVTVTWPSGARDRVDGVPVDGVISIEEGCSAAGAAWPAQCNQIVIGAMGRPPTPPDPPPGCSLGGWTRPSGSGSAILGTIVLLWLARRRTSPGRR